MLIEIYDKNHFIIGCDDRELLEVMKERMDGNKLRGKNKIKIPLKSGPKIYRFLDYDVNWGKNTKEIIDKLCLNIKKRKENIKKIKSQYSGEIKFEYNCKGIYEPMAHQKVMYNMMAYSDAAALLADPGTCKTGSYLWAIDQRIKKGQVNKALVITLSDLKKNVLKEMKIQVPHLTGVVLNEKLQAGKILNKSYKIKNKNVDYNIYLANYESMFSLVDLFDDNYFQMVVFDEAHRIGSPGSRQTKSIVKKLEFIPYKYIITGTLHANNLMSFFMPFRVLGPDTVPYANYYSFRKEYMYTVDPDGHIWKPRPGSHQVVKQIVGNLSVSFTKEECLNLPPIIRSKLTCSMGRNQEKLYKQMSKDLIAEIENMCDKCDKKKYCDKSCESELVAKNALVLTQKLRQISCGFYINTRTLIDEEGKETNDSNIITLDENPKLNLLIQTLSNMPADKKVIIWTNYRHAVKIISERIECAFGEDSYLTCYGSQDAFDQIQKFKDGKASYIIANPSKMGIGHNIQFSNYQIFFSNSHSFIERDQAESRQHRKGQENNVTITDLIVENSIDELIIKALTIKQDLSISLSELARVLTKGMKEANKIIK